jgi:hypothetical protein
MILISQSDIISHDGCEIYAEFSDSSARTTKPPNKTVEATAISRQFVFQAPPSPRFTSALVEEI